MSSRSPFGFVLMFEAALLLLLLDQGRSSNPSYLLRDLGIRVSSSSSTLLRSSIFRGTPSAVYRHGGRTGIRNPLLNTNSYFKSSRALRHRALLPAANRRLLGRRHILDLWDPLEPFEMAWEFYCNRYEIMDELLVKLLAFTRRNSVRGLTIMGITFVSAEILARLGVLGKKGEGLWDLLCESSEFREGVEERALQKTSSFVLDRGIDALRLFRSFGGKSKFAISVSTGALVGKSVIQLTTLAVRVILISFFFLETLSFLGVIGEQGETILDYIEDKRDSSTSQWAKDFARWHKKTRKKMNFELLESFYEAAVDEEKIAAFGFSLGTVVGLLT